MFLDLWPHFLGVSEVAGIMTREHTQKHFDAVELGMRFALETNN